MAEHAERRVSVCGVLKKLGVSRSEYKEWKHRRPSATELRKNGEIIAERTVGKYMKQIGVRG